MVDFACTALVDPRDWVLLQERDTHTSRWPGQWCFPGGKVEPGERPIDTAVRELAEETGVRLAPEDLTSLGVQHETDPDGEAWSWEFFVARTDLGQDDVQCFEGAQMLFRDLRDLDHVDLVTSASDVVPLVEAWLPQAPPTLGDRRFAGVLLVDRRGRILLQERDEHARIDPERWGLPGGHVEPGETFSAAAPRELLEETGVRLPAGALSFWGEIVVNHRAAHGTWDRMQVFTAEVDLDDDDIECHEGRQIVFVEPSVARTLPLTRAAEQILAAFDSRSPRAGS